MRSLHLVCVEGVGQRENETYTRQRRITYSSAVILGSCTASSSGPSASSPVISAPVLRNFTCRLGQVADSRLGHLSFLDLLLGRPQSASGERRRLRVVFSPPRYFVDFGSLLACRQLAACPRPARRSRHRGSRWFDGLLGLLDAACNFRHGQYPDSFSRGALNAVVNAVCLLFESANIWYAMRRSRFEDGVL